MRTVDRKPSGANREERSLPAAPRAPKPQDERTASVEPGIIYLGLLVSVLVAALLTTGRLADIARGQTPGPERLVATAVMEPIDRLAGMLGLARPATVIDGVLGRDDDLTDASPDQLPAPVGTVSIGPIAVVPTTAPAALPTPAPTVLPSPTAALAPSLAPTLAAATAAPAKPTTAPVVQPTVTIAPPTATRAPNLTTVPATLPPAAAGGPARRTVVAADPLRVLVAGNSLAQPLGYDIGEFGQKTGRVTSKIDTKISSGIALPEYFNWPNRLKQLLSAEPRPEVVVLFLGANDFKVMTVNGKKIEQLTPEWRVEYARRAGEVMDVIGERDARLYWIGMPVVREAWHNDVFTDINAAIGKEAAKRPWVTFVDTVPLFADANGKYVTYRPDARGEMVRVRQDDGIHLTETGTSWVSRLVFEIMSRDWKLPAIG